jgi:hypothetical protein
MYIYRLQIKWDFNKKNPTLFAIMKTIPKEAKEIALEQRNGFVFYDVGVDVSQTRQAVRVAVKGR